MPKLKTRKSIAKRIKITKKGKVLKKKAGQDHFNARESGKVKRNHAYTSHILTKKSRKRKRNLRKSGLVSDSQLKRIKQLIQA